MKWEWSKITDYISQILIKMNMNIRQECTSSNQSRMWKWPSALNFVTQKQGNLEEASNPAQEAPLALQSEAILRKRVNQQIWTEKPFKAERSWSRDKVDTLQKSGEWPPRLLHTTCTGSETVRPASAAPLWHSTVNQAAKTAQDLWLQLVWCSRYDEGPFHDETPRSWVHLVFKRTAGLLRGEGIL